MRRNRERENLIMAPWFALTLVQQLHDLYHHQLRTSHSSIPGGKKLDTQGGHTSLLCAMESCGSGVCLHRVLCSVVMILRSAVATLEWVSGVSAEGTNLGSSFLVVCGPGSCTGPLHKEKTRGQPLVSRHTDSCAGSSESATG